MALNAYVKVVLEKIPHDQDRSFRFFEGVARRFQCPFHYHPDIELTHIVASSGQRYMGDHIGRFAPGDLVLMGPNLPHSYINDAGFVGGARSRVVQFLPDCLGLGFFQRGEMKGIGRLLERSRMGLAFHGRTRDRVTQALERLLGLEGVGRLVLFFEILEILARSRECRMLASPHYSP
jgi:hypothetical protein